jgi:hypothetical protein
LLSLSWSPPFACGMPALSLCEPDGAVVEEVLDEVAGVELDEVAGVELDEVAGVELDDLLEPPQPPSSSAKVVASSANCAVMRRGLRGEAVCSIDLMSYFLSGGAFVPASRSR